MLAAAANFDLIKGDTLATSRLAAPNGWGKVYPMDLILSTRLGATQTVVVSVLLPAKETGWPISARLESKEQHEVFRGHSGR